VNVDVAATDAATEETMPGSRRVRQIAALLDGHWVVLLVAFVISAVIGLVLIAATGGDPALAARIAVDSTVGTTRGIIDTLVFTAPRLFVALGAIVALRAGIFNLGGEGQLQLGAVGSILGGYYLTQVLPGALALPAAILLSIACAAAWAAIAAGLNVWRGADIMIVTLLMNFVALYFVQLLVQGPMQAANTAFNQSERVLAAAQLPVLAGGRLHGGVVLAVVAVVLVAILFSRATLGLRLKSVGLNAIASKWQGLSIPRLTMIAMAISGGIAGMAGATEVLGVQFRLIQGFSPGYGFEGLAIAFLAALRPGRALVISLAFGGIFSTATQLQQTMGVTASLAYVVEGIPIVLLACATGLQLLRSTRRGG
jgi:simple sugar transport system permease protein